MVIAIGEITIVDLSDVHIATEQPVGPVPDQLWLDTGTVPNILKRWAWIEDEEGWGWINASPTSPEDIGAETPDGAQEKADDAVAAASTLLQSMADGTYTGGTFIDGTRIVAPEIHAGKVLGLYGSFSDMLIGDPEGARMQIAPRKPLEPYMPISGWWDGWNGVIASGHSISDLQRPLYAFDGDIDTYWFHDVDEAGEEAGEEGTWIGMEYWLKLTKYCLKRIRVYSHWNYVVSLQCSNSPFEAESDIIEWVTVDENLQLLEEQWVEIDVNENDIFAYAWRLHFGQESAAIPEIEFYGVPYEPSFAGFNRNNDRVYELSDDGLRIFNDRFFMDNNQAAVIIDQGSNGNGSYVKWSNGLQICWIPSITLTYVNTGRLDARWTFPVDFKTGSIPACTANPNQLPKYDARTAGTVVPCTESYCTVNALAPTGTFEESDTWNFQAVAIGWWK